STTWGRSERENSNADWDVPQNLRFQGQYLDRETGLHYNTFRYYDPCGGRYTQMDPIGLLGGLNTYTYMVDPLTWVDPWGLASTCLDRDWGTYFARRSGTTPPTSMVNPHAHHIVF
ncbi:RHS repeat-associated core domain-containing protein, partial [Kosakonia oryzae]